MDGSSIYTRTFKTFSLDYDRLHLQQSHNCRVFRQQTSISQGFQSSLQSPFLLLHTGKNALLVRVAPNNKFVDLFRTLQTVVVAVL